MAKTKRKLAPWTTAFKEQHRKLRPENDIVRGGVKARSGSEELRMAVYRPIAEMFKRENPKCQACWPIFQYIKDAGGNQSKPVGFLADDTQDIHHKRGRDGLLLFDIRNWLSVCRQCHNWIRDNPEAARKLGLDETHK